MTRLQAKLVLVSMRHIREAEKDSEVSYVLTGFKIIFHVHIPVYNFGVLRTQTLYFVALTC